MSALNAEDLAPGIYSEVEEVMREIRARLPYDQPITLSSGRVFRLKKFAPVKNSDTQGWCFGFDARFETGKGADHFEFYVYHTGGGGPMCSEMSVNDTLEQDS